MAIREKFVYDSGHGAGYGLLDGMGYGDGHNLDNYHSGKGYYGHAFGYGCGSGRGYGNSDLCFPYLGYGSGFGYGSGYVSDEENGIGHGNGYGDGGPLNNHQNYF